MSIYRVPGQLGGVQCRAGPGWSGPGETRVVLAGVAGARAGGLTGPLQDAPLLHPLDKS